MIKDYTKKNHYTIPQGLQQESQLFQAVLRKVKKKKNFFPELKFINWALATYCWHGIF